MRFFIKIYLLGLVCLLAACGDAETPTEVSATKISKPATRQTSSPHTIQGMKNVMDDARGVEDMMQKRADEQRREIDNIR